MAIRFLHASPKELLAMSTEDLLTAIRISEGRVILVASRVRCGNLVDYASNGEVSAAFGADIVMLDTYEPMRPFITGWPSKDPADDEATKDIQVPMGRGWTLKEIREIIGRPVAILLLLQADASKAGSVKHYGNILATPENTEKAIESGADMIFVSGWVPKEVTRNTLKEMRKITNGKAILSFGRSHGPGLIGQSDFQLGPEGLFSEDEIKIALDEGVDFVSMPAPGTYPGYTVDFVARRIELIHSYGAMASLGIHTSQEGADIDTLRRIAILAKQAGADMHELGDSGFNEMMIEPQNIMNYSIAIRGRRHTYRRMAMSIKR